MNLEWHTLLYNAFKDMRLRFAIFTKNLSSNGLTLNKRMRTVYFFILFFIFPTGATTLTEIDITATPLTCHLSFSSKKPPNSPVRAMNLPKEEMEEWFQLGFLQLHGSGTIARNPAQAKEIFEMLARKGHRQAKFELAKLLLEGYSEKLGDLIRTEPKKALRILRWLAFKGYGPAQEFLTNYNRSRFHENISETDNVVPITKNLSGSEENLQKRQRL